MRKNFDENLQYVKDDSRKIVGVFLSIKRFEEIMRELEDCREALLSDQAYEEFTQCKCIERV